MMTVYSLTLIVEPPQEVQVSISQIPSPAVVGMDLQIVCSVTPFTSDIASVSLSIDDARVENAIVVNGTIFVFPQVTFEVDGQRAQCVVASINNMIVLSDILEINVRNPCKLSNTTCTFIYSP